MEEKVVYTVDEVAVVLGISRPLAYLSVKRGEIPSIRIGKRLLIPVAALNKKLESCYVPPNSTNLK